MQSRTVSNAAKELELEENLLETNQHVLVANKASVDKAQSQLVGMIEQYTQDLRTQSKSQTVDLYAQKRISPLYCIVRSYHNTR